MILIYTICLFLASISAYIIKKWGHYVDTSQHEGFFLDLQ